MNCNGCTACCEWGGDHKLKPNTNLRMSPISGNCVHLGPEGCEIYNDRPLECRVYDCRVTYVEVMGRMTNPVIKVLIASQTKASDD